MDTTVMLREHLVRHWHKTGVTEEAMRAKIHFDNDVSARRRQQQFCAVPNDHPVVSLLRCANLLAMARQPWCTVPQHMTLPRDTVEVALEWIAESVRRRHSAEQQFTPYPPRASLASRAAAGASAVLPRVSYR